MNNRLEQLVEYCHKTNMSYSYKPVLIMALVQHDGVITIQDAAHEFIQYYRNRLSFGLIAERSNSIYNNLNCTIEQIISNNFIVRKVFVRLTMKKNSNGYMV